MHVSLAATIPAFGVPCSRLPLEAETVLLSPQQAEFLTGYLLQGGAVGGGCSGWGVVSYSKPVYNII